MDLPRLLTFQVLETPEKFKKVGLVIRDGAFREGSHEIVRGASTVDNVLYYVGRK